MGNYRLDCRQVDFNILNGGLIQPVFLGKCSHQLQGSVSNVQDKALFLCNRNKFLRGNKTKVPAVFQSHQGFCGGDGLFLCIINGLINHFKAVSRDRLVEQLIDLIPSLFLFYYLFI